MTPLEYYQKKIASGEVLPDAQQLAVMQQLEKIYQVLIIKPNFFSKLLSKPESLGVYLWGNVGIGKTFLLDTFYYALPFNEKLRIHFHAFMRQLHADLRELKSVKNPLEHIARQWAKRTRIICFDEFIVNDIADALLLGNLLMALFAQGVYLVITSNFAPDDLYRHGLQRELFLPTIEKIKSALTVIHLTIADDYRSNFATQRQYYWYPLTAEAERHMEASFQQFTQNGLISTAPLDICERKIKVRKSSAEVVWFDFPDICGIPRNQEDYLVLVQQYKIILVSGLPIISPQQHDLARSFISFIDVLYEAKTRLVISAAVPIDKIYAEGLLLFEFQRTRSRLLQMQSEEWGKYTRKAFDI